MSEDHKIPIAALSLSQRAINDINKLYPKFPLDKLYNLILIDCPWKYQSKQNKPPYPLLEIGDLKKLPIKNISNDDCLLLMWTTNPMKDKALKLMEYFGFRYEQTLFTWAKIRSNGQPASLPGKYTYTSTEELLVGVKGNISRFLKGGKKLPQQLQSYPTTRHSEKPKQFQEQLDLIFNFSKMECLEIFARERTLKHFDLYGNELSPIFQVSLLPREQQQLNLTVNEIQERVQSIMDYFHNDNKTSTRSQTDLLRSIIKRHISVFAFSKSELGLTDVLQHHIELTKDSVPIRSVPYKYAPKEEETIEAEIDLLTKLGCIEQSTSEWASPIVLVKKPNGEMRMCIDYRGLNKQTLRDQYPLPRIDRILVTVCKGKYFTRIDLKSGFWQIAVHYRDRFKTSFVSHKGTFQWKRMPMGLTNAPATFQRIMNIVLSGLEFCLVYLDDVIIYSQTIEQHFIHLDQVLQKLSEANLKLGPDKCSFLQESIELLGHRITQNIYEPLSSRVEAILKIAPPKDVKHVQIFLGLVNYHGQFIKDFAKIAKPIRDLTKKNVPFVWTLQQETAFNKLKEAIASKPILSIPIPNKIMILYTDFSIVGLGAVLAQQISDKEEQVIEYASRTLKKHENNYPAYKGEILAVSWAVHKFRYFLLQAPFKIVLDNEAAVALLRQHKTPQNINNLQRTVLNWILELNDFTFQAIHRPGKTHQNADALSRLPQVSITTKAQDPQINNQIISTILSQLPIHTQQEIYSLNLNWWGASENLSCITCKSTAYTEVNNEMLICDYCGKAIHQNCHKPRISFPPQGAWYCYECLSMAKEQYPNIDITLNFPLLEFLKSSTYPSDFDENSKLSLKDLASQYLYHNYRLRLKINDTVVPTVNERRILLHSTHDTSGHMNADSLFHIVKGQYYWPNMQRDIYKFVAQCEHCSYMNPNFVNNPNMKPTQKGDQPFAVIHVDLTGDLQLQLTSRKNRYIMIIVDSFSKWIEIYPIPNAKATTTSSCLFDFIKRFGCPQQIVTDKGTEFKGEFQNLIENLRIQLLTIAPRNPQANGQVEIYVKIVKKILRRFVNSPTQKVEWDEVCPMIQISMNTTPSKSTKYSPHFIVFGRETNFPSSVVVDPLIDLPMEPSTKDIEIYCNKLVKQFKTINPIILQNITNADLRNKKYYDIRNSKTQEKIHQGDLVLVRIPRPTKLGPLGKGPYQFQKYTNKEQTSALLIDPTQIKTIKENNKEYFCCKTFIENTSNLAKVNVKLQNYEVDLPES